MRQVWITKHGGPEVLEVREAEDPEPKDDQVRIRVAAAGVNFADIMIRVGVYPNAPKLPAVIGYEVSGTIDALGEHASRFSVGDRVLALTSKYGGYSDTVVLPEQDAYPIPDNISTESAAAIPVNYLTAWLMLINQAHIQPGETVLIHSAAGGVGLAALQICRIVGAKALGRASTHKHKRLGGHGLEDCLDSADDHWENSVMRATDGYGVDVILDSVGGRSVSKGLRCLAPMGRIVVFGVSSFVTQPRRNWWKVLNGFFSTKRVHPLSLLNRNLSLSGFNLGPLSRNRETISKTLKCILEQTSDGQLQPVVDKSFTFDEAARSHQYIQDRKNFGKILLIP